MLLTEELEKKRKLYVKTLSGLHIGVEEVLVHAEDVMLIIPFKTCEEHNLFSYVMETEQEPIAKGNDSSSVLKRAAETRLIGLAPVNPKLLLQLMKDAGKP